MLSEKTEKTTFWNLEIFELGNNLIWSVLSQTGPSDILIISRKTSLKFVALGILKFSIFLRSFDVISWSNSLTVSCNVTIEKKECRELKKDRFVTD